MNTDTGASHPQAMTTELLLLSCRLYDAPGDAVPVDVLVAAGRIVSVGGGRPTPAPGVTPGARQADAPDAPGSAGPPAPGPGQGLAVHAPERRVLDAGGRTLVPGFIDLHVHGGGGADVLDGTEDALRTISTALARVGTTAFLATTFLDPDTGNRHLCTAAECVGRDLGGAQVLGLHLEGPFVSPDRRGGLPLTAIRPPSPELLEEILEMTQGRLRLMTIAPELPGALGLIRTLDARGVVASLGHTAASYEEAKAGIACGIRHATHLYNAMPSLHHREPGPLLAIFEDERVTADLVCDGVHVHPAVVGWTYRVLGPGRCICISDGVRAVGLPDGRYLYGGREFEAKDGTARYLDGTLIGTAAGVGKLALRLQRYTGCPLSDAVHAATRNPARLLGLASRKGSIEPGKDADLVILEPDGSVWATIVGGRIVYSASDP